MGHESLRTSCFELFGSATRSEIAWNISSSLRSSPIAKMKSTRAPPSVSIKWFALSSPRNISTSVPFDTPCGLISTWPLPGNTSTGSFTSTDSRWSISSLACQLPKSGSASPKCQITDVPLSLMNDPSVESVYCFKMGSTISCHFLMWSSVPCGASCLQTRGDCTTPPGALYQYPCSARIPRLGTASLNQSSSVFRARPLTMHTAALCLSSLSRRNESSKSLEGAWS
mmetsp:Transcript_13443/g.44470  ORF Transcript_13443/g.44470 Transcript_13443/m.44470 type:complete len:227 (+) Transcript_13443:301-981(+)